MSVNAFDDEGTFVVLVNHEEQYSLWPVDKEIPKGWSATGQQGTKKECMAYVDEVWTDMRPLSLRRAMQARATEQGGR
jgi:MbtH protein